MTNIKTIYAALQIEAAKHEYNDELYAHLEEALAALENAEAVETAQGWADEEKAQDNVAFPVTAQQTGVTIGCGL